MCIQTTKLKNIVLWSPRQKISFQTSLILKQALLVFSLQYQTFSGWNSLSRLDFTDLTNSNLKFDFGATPTTEHVCQKMRIFDKET